MTKSKKPKLNVRLLRRVQKHIEAEPRRMKMKLWLDRNPFERERSALPPCGTTACIAGWALILSGKHLRREVNYLAQGQKILGLTRDEAGNLFVVENWPENFRRKYNTDSESLLASMVPAKDIRKNARVAVARIEHFIKTRE
jgi:hypothetical protein